MKTLAIATYLALIGLVAVVAYVLLARSATLWRSDKMGNSQREKTTGITQTVSATTHPPLIKSEILKPDSDIQLRIGIKSMTETELFADIARITRPPYGLTESERETLIATALKTPNLQKWASIPFYGALLPQEKRELQLRVLRSDPLVQTLNQDERAQLIVRLKRAFPDSAFRFERFVVAQPGFALLKPHDSDRAKSEAMELDNRMSRMTRKRQSDLLAMAEKHLRR